jgi:hypothetical protein
MHTLYAHTEWAKTLQVSIAINHLKWCCGKSTPSLTLPEWQKHTFSHSELSGTLPEWQHIVQHLSILQNAFKRQHGP